jgi:hypothetical protein
LAWFWVPHQIILNILVPIGGVVAFMVGIRLRRLTRSQNCVLGSMTGLFVLAYPNALICPMTFFLGGVYGWLKWMPLGTREAIIRLALYAAAMAFVMLAWFLPYLLMFGKTVSHEANLGQFRWLPEAVRDDEVLSAVALHLNMFAGSLAIYVGPYGVALLLVLFAALSVLRVHSPRALRDPVLLASGTTMIAMMLFNFFHGYHPGRLLLFPLLLLVIATSRALLLIGFGRTAAGYLLAVTAIQVALALARPALSQE